MPPNGLYPIPRNHLYGGGYWQAPRQKFNTLDFLDKSPPPEKTPAKGLPQQVDGAVDGDIKSAETTSAKKKKKHARDAQGTIAPDTSATKAKSDVASSKLKNKTKDLKEEGNARNADKPAKKRKRESVGTIETPNTNRKVLSNGNLVLGPGSDFMDGVKSTLGDLGASFSSPAQKSKPAQATPKPKKKGKTAKAKPTPKTAPSNSAQKTTEKNDAAASHERTKEKKTKDKDRREKKLKLRKQRELKESEKSGTPVNPTVAAVASPYASTPRKTPVPLPFEYLYRKPHKKDNFNAKLSQPGNDTTRSTPVANEGLASPIPVTKRPRTPISSIGGSSQSSRESTPVNPRSTRIVDISPPTVERKANAAANKAFMDALGTDATPVAEEKTEKKNKRKNNRKKNEKEEKGQSNAPGEPRPGPTANTSKNKSKVNGQSNTAAQSKSTLNTPKDKNKPITPVPKGTHASKQLSTAPNIASKQPLTSTKPTTTNTPSVPKQDINYTAEQVHLTAYLAFRDALASAGPPPCLRRATGCTAKRDKLLHLHTQEQIHAGTETQNEVAGHSGAVGPVEGPVEQDGSPAQTSLQNAVQSLMAAETLLQLSLRAGMPVPLPASSVAGTYALFCPAYSAAHKDRFEMGMRTLVITPISASQPSTYEAHLHIPPRPVPFATQSFTPRSYASFGATLLRTLEEGYEMEAVFLGSGYAVLRMDLGLLLNGRRGEGKDGEAGGKEGVMEFIAVREGAVAWGGGGGE